jgi:hypothetical protein
MVSFIETWDGDEWEAHVGRLLHDRHGATNVQKAPARHQGDGGLDYYCLSEAVIYQCYAVQEPVDVATRADKQKAKITADVGKICKVDGTASIIFKSKPIERWILIVPCHDSQEVNKHAAKKALEIRQQGLAHISPNFEILVHDRDDFEEESWNRRASLRARLKPHFMPASAEDVAKLGATRVDLVENLRRKLAKRVKEADDIEDDVDDAIRSFVDYQNALDFLRANAPLAHEEIVALISQRLRRLKLVGAKAGKSPANVLEAELDGLIESLAERAPNLDPYFAQQLAFGALSDWLMRCPLDFA